MSVFLNVCLPVKDLVREREREESMTVADFQRSKKQAFFIPPVLQDALTPLTSFSLNQIHLLFRHHLHNFQQGFPNKQCLSCSYLPTLHPSRSPAAPPSIKACPVLSSGIETGTGRWLGTGGSKVMSEERHRVTVCQGFVLSMWKGNMWRGRWGGGGKR